MYIRQTFKRITHEHTIDHVLHAHVFGSNIDNEEYRETSVLDVITVN